MDIVWQDSPGSFLDPGSIDAAGAFAPAPGADGSALWSGAPQDVFASSDALLWEPSSGGMIAADAGPADWFGASTKSFDIAWADDSSAPALLWQSNGSGALAPFSAAVSLGGTEWSSPYTPPDILWSSGEPNNAPALTMAASPAPQFTSAGFYGTAPQSLASIPPSQLLWDQTAFAPGQSTTPSGGQPSGNSFAGGSSLNPTIAVPTGDRLGSLVSNVPQSGSVRVTGLPADAPTHP